MKTNMDGTVREIHLISREIRRLYATLKIMREQKRKHEKLLLEYMYKQGIREYGGITRHSLEKNITPPLFPKKERESFLKGLFSEYGFKDPNQLLSEIKQIQTMRKGNSDISQD